jgi:phenylacetate-CoA ligase
VRRLAAQSPFYSARFAAAGLDTRKVELEAIAAIAPTTKADLVDRPADLLCRDTAPYLSTRTTGTTGRPAEVWMSRYEAELWPAMAALSGLLRNEINQTDCLQINLSSRATAAVQHDLEVCRLVGARSRALGLIDVDHSLDSLLDGGGGRPTILGTYPSYLARLVAAARRRGLGPDDFGLRRIDIAGELLSAAVVAATEETLGVRPTDTFAMTEILPVSGRSCQQGHLHIDLNMGLVEVIALDGSGPAAPGELGTMVVTPYFPYRECMPVFRYDTRDVVRRLPDVPLTCSLAGVPALSPILGKASQLLRLADGVVTPRDLVEVIEALPSNPWPAQYRTVVTDGRLELTLPPSVLETTSTDEVARRFAHRGIACTVATGASDERLRPVRADLIETTFTADRTPTDLLTTGA